MHRYSIGRNPRAVPNLADLDEALASVSQSYSKLILVVGPPRSGKTSLLSAFADARGRSINNVNLQLAKSLLDLSERQRKTHTVSVLSDIVSRSDGPILLDNTEILFDRTLALDPLRLLNQLARNIPVVATWNGHCRDGRLTYAVPSHPEFISTEEVDAVIINLEAQ